MEVEKCQNTALRNRKQLSENKSVFPLYRAYSTRGRRPTTEADYFCITLAMVPHARSGEVHDGNTNEPITWNQSGSRLAITDHGPRQTPVDVRVERHASSTSSTVPGHNRKSPTLKHVRSNRSLLVLGRPRIFQHLRRRRSACIRKLETTNWAPSPTAIKRSPRPQFLSIKAGPEPGAGLPPAVPTR